MWRHRANEREVEIADQQTLILLVQQGRIRPEDLLYHPVLGKWQYAAETREIAHLFGNPDRNAKASFYNRFSMLIGIFGICVLFLSPIVGVLFIAIGIVFSIMYYASR